MMVSFGKKLALDAEALVLGKGCQWKTLSLNCGHAVERNV